MKDDVFMQTDRHACRQAERQTDKQAGRQTDRQKRETDRQTGRQKGNRQSERQDGRSSTFRFQSKLYFVRKRILFASSLIFKAIHTGNSTDGEDLDKMVQDG